MVGIILLEYADDDFVWDIQEWVFLDRVQSPMNSLKTTMAKQCPSSKFV